MYGESLFETWATPYSVWTPWVKPVLFAQISSPPPGGALDREWQTMDTSWAPPLSQRTALIIDLPGEVPLLIGLSLAQRGYRPVVLYNCCNGPNPVLEMDECMLTLASGERVLRNVRLPQDAPPAFLIDSRRTRPESLPNPGTFDNRWVVFPQDFPSATFLQSQGIDRAVVTQLMSGQPAADLAHVLLRWQEAGVEVSTAPLGQPPAPVHVRRPSLFRYAWYSLWAAVGLRANSAGGFGSTIPIPSPSGGGGGWG